MPTDYRVCKIEKEFRFEAAHQLPNHKGKCSNLHGHSYRLKVMVKGVIQECNPENPLSSDGMVMDFYDLSNIVKSRIIEVCDHKFLNEVFPGMVTTAENLAYKFYEVIHNEFCRIYGDVEVGEGLAPHVVHIKLYETDTSCVTVTDTDFFDSSVHRRNYHTYTRDEDGVEVLIDDEV